MQSTVIHGSCSLSPQLYNELCCQNTLRDKGRSERGFTELPGKLRPLGERLSSLARIIGQDPSVYQDAVFSPQQGLRAECSSSRSMGIFLYMQGIVSSSGAGTDVTIQYVKAL